MNRAEALQRAGNEEGGSKTRHHEPDTRPMKQQIEEKEFNNFDKRMAQAALKFDKLHSKWPDPQWFTGHRSNFRKAMNERYTDDTFMNPPCKHWEASLGVSGDAPLALVLGAVWRASVRDWALEHPYLASPSSPCQCRKCMPNSPAFEFNDPQDHWPAMKDPFDEN